MVIPPLFFYVFAGLAIALSLMVILKKNPVSSAFSLVLVFFCFAAIYALMSAHLLATLQILVYAGAVMVLFVFVIMLLNADSPSLDLAKTGLASRIGAGVLCFGLFLLMTWAFKESAVINPTSEFTPERVAQLGGNTRVVSRLMFSEYILPFELTSVLILGSIVGAVAIAKRHSSTKGKGTNVR